MKKHTLLLIFFSLMLAMGISACSFSLAQDVTPPPGYQAPVYEEPEVLTGAFPSQVPNLENGAAIYQEKCLPCHGDTGLGDGPDSTALPVEVARIGAANVADLAAPLEWYSIVMNGNIDRFMPPFAASLSEQDVWDVVSYVVAFSTDENAVAEGAALFAENCAVCHGEQGAGPVAPGAFDFRNSEQVVAFSLDDFVQKIATGNGNPDHVFSAVLDESQQRAVATYLRSLVLPLAGQPAEVAAGETEASPTEAAAPTEVASGADSTAGETASTQEEPLGKVTGSVVNGSGGDLPEGLEVTLEVYQSFDLMYTETIPADADGGFVFEDVVLDPDLIYITMVEKDGTFFPSAFHMGNETIGDTIDLPVTIYDATSDTSQLAISRLHVFFQFTDQGTVQVVHQVSISNFGNFMVAPDNETQPVLNFTLPEGATNLIFQTGTLGNPYQKTEKGFADPSPVLPGSNSYEGLYAYELPYDGKLDWALPLDLPTDVAVIFVQGEDVKVTSAALMPSGTETLDQDVFQVFVANALSEGQDIELQISGSGLARLNLDGNLLTIILGLVGLGLAGFGAWRIFRPVEEFEGDYDEFEDDLVDGLMDQIVDLDESFVAGEIDEAFYQARRDSLKAKLKRLLDQEEAD